MGFLRLYGSPGVGNRSADLHRGFRNAGSQRHLSCSALELTLVAPRAAKRVVNLTA